jgi:hypothetical protein
VGGMLRAFDGDRDGSGGGDGKGKNVQKGEAFWIFISIDGADEDDFDCDPGM